MVLIVEGLVGEERLDNVLAIVKCAVDGQVVHIVVEYGRHLSFLDRRHTAAWMQNENVNILLGAQSCDCRTACVATCRAKHRQRVGRTVSPVGVASGGVSASEEILEQVSKQLESDIFERKCWSVPQFQAPFVLRDTAQRRHVLVAERRVRFRDQLSQVIRRYTAFFGRGWHE